METIEPAGAFLYGTIFGINATMRFVTPAITYFKEVRMELKRVNWPRREETVRYTVIVVLMSAAVGVFLGGLDFIFSRLLSVFINR